jgi:transglutaminase-like putative cysteine protease
MPLAPSASAPAPLSAASLSGIWLGTLRDEKSGQRLQLHLDLSQMPPGCSLDSLDESAYGIPCSVTATSPSLTIDVPAAHGSLAGTAADDGNTIHATWTQAHASLPIELARQAAPIEPPATMRIAPLAFSDAEDSLPRPFLRNAPSDPYLVKLRATYRLAELVAGKNTDYERVRLVSRWVRSRWGHNGDNEPQSSDPLSILREADAGKQFRCVEYAIVLAGALNSLGIPARVLELKTQDADRVASGAGHVVAEAWLRELTSWIMVDGQFDVIPTAKGQPLNAVGLQGALARREPTLGVDSLSGANAEEYFAWVGPYLYYFSTPFDARYPAAKQPGDLYLYPLGAATLTVFQRKWPIRDAFFTHSVRAFYAAP